MGNQEFFNALEEAYYAQEGMPQAPAAFGKLWSIVQGLWTKGVNPIVVINMIYWIMDTMSKFNTLSVEEIIQKVLEFLRLSSPTV